MAFIERPNEAGEIVQSQVDQMGQSLVLQGCVMDGLLNDSRVAVCVKDRQKRVLHQNPSCIASCGNRVGQDCATECMKWIKSRAVPTGEEGFLLARSQQVCGSEFDVMVLSKDEHVTCMLYPVSEKHEKEMQFFRNAGLSNRELEIMSMVIRDFTNSQIMDSLTISKATLKTHLNNIYKKLPSDARFDIRTRGFKR